MLCIRAFVRPFLRTSFLFATIFATSRTFATLAPNPDQEFIPGAEFVANAGAANQVDWAQSFTVATAGKLASVEIPIAKYQSVTLPLQFDLRSIVAGKPTESDSAVLASVTVPASAVATEGSSAIIPPWLAIDLRPFDVNVTPGQLLALVVRSDDPGKPFNGSTYGWYGDNSDAYASGEAFIRIGAVWQTAASHLGHESDLGFRAFVVPEPSDFNAVIVGLLGLGATAVRGSAIHRRSKSLGHVVT